MIAPSLAKLGEDLRNAVARRAYGEVERLLTSLGPAAMEQVDSLPADDPRIGEIGIWASELLSWTEIMLRSARAAQADELRRIPFVRSYLRQQSL